MKQGATPVGIFLLVILLVSLASCKGIENLPEGNSYKKDVTVSDKKYAKAEKGYNKITEASISGDSLTIQVEYGGGCGKFNAELVARETVLEIHPPQRDIILSFSNKDNCEAIKTTSLTFNISKIKSSGAKVSLFLEGWDTPLSY